MHIAGCSACLSPSFGKVTFETRTRAPQPAPPETGIRLHTRAVRELATAYWLLSAHPAPASAATEWTEQGIALLPLGTLMSAVRLPQDLVRAVADSHEREDIDSFLDEALNAGPVICDPQGARYYALVPACMPTRWRMAVMEWRALGVKCLGPGSCLGVPRPQSVSPEPGTRNSYWAVPMPSAGALCRPLDIARLIAAGQQLTGDEQ